MDKFLAIVVIFFGGCFVAYFIFSRSKTEQSMEDSIGPLNAINWIPVLPKNYRSIALYAIEKSESPTLKINKKYVPLDVSDSGPLTQRRIRELRDFEIYDGDISVLGFHDHPNEMWIDDRYREVAEYCSEQGWLKIQGSAH